MNDGFSKLDVLLIEGDPGKIALVRTALQQSNVKCRFRTVCNPCAMNCLRRDEPYREAPMPDLILFDFFEPERRWLRTLDRIRADKLLCEIPLVLLTSSESERCVERFYRHKDNGVALSPIELESFLRALQSFTTDRFLSAVKLIASLGFVFVRLPGH